MGIESIEQNTREKVFCVYLRDGRTFSVAAATFAHRPNPDDHIKFIASSGAERDDVFLRAPETAAIAPESSTIIPAPIVALQHAFEALKIRVENIENNLGDIVHRAVAKAFSDRGL